MKIYKHECLRCGHSWASKRAKPLRCARCKTPYWNRPKGESQKEDTCYFCMSNDILVPEVGVAFGMSGEDYSFCRKCLRHMTAEEFWRRMFVGQDLDWPPKQR